MEEQEKKTFDLGKRLKNAFTSKPATKIYASLLCILISLILALIILLCISPTHAFSEFGVMVTGGLSYFRVTGIGRLLANAAPLICTGLSIIFAYKTGVFNIGCAGQYVMGVLGALMFALQFNCHWTVCLLMAYIFGAIWGAIPGLLKSFFNVNEVISGIMLNWIALLFTNYLFQTALSGCVDIQQGSKTFSLSYKNPSAVLPNLGITSLGSNFTIAIFIAVILAILVWYVMKKNVLGFELTASGLNRTATRYAGMKEKRNVILSMAIAGGLAGIGAGLYYLSQIEQWSVQLSSALPDVPWNGIIVAFVAQLSPIGAIFSSLFITLISQGAMAMTQNYFPSEIADLITGIIVYLSGLTNLALIFIQNNDFEKWWIKFKEYFAKISRKNTKKQEIVDHNETLEIDETIIDENNKEEK